MSKEERDKLVFEYYYLVRLIAFQVVRRMPHLDVDEFIQHGVIGLIEAIDRYDPERGVPLKPYAEMRIRGAILDALRWHLGVPRAVIRRREEIQAATDRLYRQLGRVPTKEEVARELGLTIEEYHAALASASVSRPVSIHTAEDDTEGKVAIEDALPSTDPDVTELWAEEETRKEVLEILELLPAKEREVVRSYYLYGLSLKQIGENFGFTEGRACQLRSAGVTRIRDLLARRTR